jgi:hypothetical protein
MDWDKAGHITCRAAGAVAICGALVLIATPSGAADRSVPTNLPGVRAYPAPPAGFEPLTATPQELEDVGLPMRPDPNVNPSGYAAWKRAVTTPTTRIIPQLEVTDIYHRPLQVVTPSSEGAPEKSSNWSGYIVLSSATKYGSASSFGYVSGYFVVPWVLQPIGKCGTPVYASEWVGIDGVSKDTALIQAGVNGVSSCRSGKQTLTYSTWYEWFPLPSVNFKNFPTSPGDDYSVYVESLSATKAKAFLVNYVENKSVSITFSAPGGSRVIGNSAEWILEAPTVGGGQTAVANYSQDYFGFADAENFDLKYSYPGEPASGVQSVESEMINKSGTLVSVPELLGPTSIFFYVTGPAR